MEDEQIVGLYWQRDEEAVRQTAEKYGAYCQAIAGNILGSREDAEECVNDTWVHAWNAIPPAKPERLGLFLARITRRLAINRIAAQNAKKRGGGEIHLVLDELAECLASEKSVEDEAMTRELESCIRQFVRELSARDAGLFVRRYFYAESLAQAAAHMRITENNAAVILSRIRRRLKARLKKEGFFDGQN